MTRPMTNALRAALDGISPSARRVIHEAAAQDWSGTRLGPLLHGLSTQLRAEELTEQELLAALARDRLADVDELDAAHPYPPADPSLRLTLDPDTGEIRPERQGE